MYESLAVLYGRATGGSDVAAKPGNELAADFPQGPEPAGVETATSWFNARRKAGDIAFLFLVGGPGGGKSHISADLVRDLPEIDPQTNALAHRKHTYQDGESRIILVNDATIKIDELDGGFLKSDVAAALDSGDSLIACVNRGILVEEETFSAPSKGIADQIVGWLSHPDEIASDEVVTHVSTTYLRVGQLKSTNGMTVHLAVVYVDSCSLLEKLPSNEINLAGADIEVAAREYLPSTFANRRLNSIDSIPALSLIRSISTKIQDFSDRHFDVANPIAANIKNLENPHFLSGLGSVLRASEIAAGKRFSYRDIWGITARMVVGDLPNTVPIEGLGAHLDIIFSLPSTNELEKFQKYLKLAELRLSQSLFEVTSSQLLSPKTNTTHLITRVLGKVDPVLDSSAGNFSSTNTDSGWSDLLMDCFSGAAAATSPLESLITSTSQNHDDNFAINVTEFEHELDESFVNLMQADDLDSSTRLKFIRWYSTYLSRLYALANGIPAFRNEISAWLDLMAFAPNIPNHLEDKILTLIRPPSGSGEHGKKSLIPVFDSRTLPFIGYVQEPKIAVELGDIKVRTKRAGDELFLIVEENTQVIAHIILDFPLMREINSASAGTVGVTEFANATAPRLERLRSSRLAPKLISKSTKFSLVQRTEITTLARQEMN